jgi:hypothetical protein
MRASTTPRTSYPARLIETRDFHSQTNPYHALDKETDGNETRSWDLHVSFAHIPPE